MTKDNLLKIAFLLFFLAFWAVSALAQVDTSWERRYNGPGNGGDETFSIAVDGSGDVYVTGESYGSGTYKDYATGKNWACTPGDFNGDSYVNTYDVIYLIAYLFTCGPPPPCQPVEANGNCELDYGDLIYLINYLFIPGSPAPVAWCSNPDTYSDPGNRDTIRIETVCDSAGTTVDVPVYVYNDEAIYSVIPLKIDTTYVKCDSVVTTGTRGAGIIKGIPKYCKDNTGILLFPDGNYSLPAGSGTVAYLRCRIKNGAPPGLVKIDSTFLDPNKLRFFKNDATLFSIKPIFISGGINIPCVICEDTSQVKTTDLVFVMDGSGSIYPSDFQLQKEGYAEAVRSDSCIPHCGQNSGKIRVGVVQFSSSAQIQLPMTPVTSSNADSIANIIEGLTQMGNNTNFEDGITKACTLIAGSTAEIRAIIFSTDGYPNVGNTNPVFLRNKAQTCGFTELDAIGVGPGPIMSVLDSLVFPQPPNDYPGKSDSVSNFLEFKEVICGIIQKVWIGGPSIDCNLSFSDSTLTLCPLGDIPFHVFLRDSLNNPVVGYSNVWLDFLGCPGITPCTPAHPQWPLVYPVAPSDSSGKVTFYVKGGGCDTTCLVQVKADCGIIASVPVKTLDNSGNLYVSYSDFDSSYGLCRDYNCDDTVDYRDLEFFKEHKRHSCVTGPPNPCQYFRKYLVVDPDTNLSPGKITKVTLFVQNNSTTACFVDSIKFYYSGFGALDTLKWFSSLIVGFNLSPGDSLMLGVDFLWLDTTAVVFYARFYTDCCSTYIQAERNINRVRQCPPTAMDVEFYWGMGFSPVYLETLSFVPSGWSDSIDYSFLPNFLKVIIRTSNLSPLGTKGSLTLAAFTDPGRTDFVAERTFEVFVTLNSGDVNADCKVALDDVVFLANYVLKGQGILKSIQAADVNCDCKVSLADVVYLANYILKPNSPPLVPSDSCSCRY